MDKIKKLFSGMVNSVKEAFYRFPITIMIVYLLTLMVTFLVIGTELSADVREMLAHIFAIGTVSAFGSWLTEAIFTDKADKRKIIGYVVSFAIGILFDRLIEADVLDEYLLSRWLCLYLTVTFIGAVYVLIRKAEVSFEKYSLNLILNVKRASIIYGIVAIGFLILYAIFVALILEDGNFDIFLKILCMFTGFYYMPVVLKAFANEEAEDTKFNRAVFSKVLLPLLLLAMLIVYIYLVKIFLVTEVPKNQLFGILSMIFVFAFPLYVINKNYMEKGSFIDKINRAIPYLFTPFIFLQIYSIGIRIKEYGLTESRYMAVVLIVFEIIAIGISVYKNSKYLKELLLVGIGIFVVVLVSPFNYEDMPLQSQKKIVDSYVAAGKDFESLTEYDKKRFASAYQYIDDDEELINPSLSLEEKEKLASYNTYRYVYNYNDDEEDEETPAYVRLDKTIDMLDISGYSKIYEIPYRYSDDGTIIHYSRENSVSVGGQTFGTSENSDDVGLTFDIDLREYIDKLIEANNNSQMTADRVFEELAIIKIDENRDLYLTEISFNYYKNNSDKVNDLRIEGFVLEK